MADDDSLWEPTSQRNHKVNKTETPRWQHIRTQAEQQDSENSLHALESKLARLKSRPIKTTICQPTDIIQHQEGAWHSDSSDENDDSEDDMSIKGREDHEGLYLLWKDHAQQGRYEYNDALDKAIDQQKREQEYTWHWTLNWIPKCCSCCFTPSSS